jgi:hypothetical protein
MDTEYKQWRSWFWNAVKSCLLDVNPVSNPGNIRPRKWDMPGDDFGKFSLEDPESTNLFLGDGSGKKKSVEDGK